MRQRNELGQLPNRKAAKDFGLALAGEGLCRDVGGGVSVYERNELPEGQA